MPGRARCRASAVDEPFAAFPSWDALVGWDGCFTGYRHGGPARRVSMLLGFKCRNPGATLMPCLDLARGVLALVLTAPIHRYPNGWFSAPHVPPKVAEHKHRDRVQVRRPRCGVD